MPLRIEGASKLLSYRAIRMEIQYTEFQDKLVRGLAHKMNNILSLFHGYLGIMLEDSKLDPEVREHLSRIQQGAQAATDLIDRTKALVRPTSLIWREVSPHEFLYGLRPTIEEFLERNVSLEIECPDEMPKVHVDASRLRNAILEIVKNAIEASKPNGVVRLSATLEERSPNGRRHPKWVAIKIEDSGDGIPEKIKDRVFEPFFTTRSPKGAIGLGLPVAAGLVQQFEGSLTFTSEPGRTVFTIHLPASSEMV